jgi:hypothetical protein
MVIFAGNAVEVAAAHNEYLLHVGLMHTPVLPIGHFNPSGFSNLN